MGSRPQILVLVAVAALAGAGAVVGVTLATRQTPVHPKPLEGKPPLPDKLPTPAAKEIRAAYADWPDGTLETMQRLGREHPRDEVVQLYRGIALIWGGYTGNGEEALLRAKRLGRDTMFEVQADDLLHPQYFSGYPVFDPIKPNALLERGSQLQREGRHRSAARLYERAARQNPNDDEARVAAAVARFDKANLTASFSRLGPLTRLFPQSQSVRFYLGLLLAWTGERQAAVTQFEKALALGPKTELGQAAADFLARVGERGTKTPNK
jgi:tetratricopeptide (TPR) repeat protein